MRASWPDLEIAQFSATVERRAYRKPPSRSIAGLSPSRRRARSAMRRRSAPGLGRDPEVALAPLASSRRVQTGRLSWTRATGSHGSLSKQRASRGSIRGLTGWRKFETCPVWGANGQLAPHDHDSFGLGGAAQFRVERRQRQSAPQREFQVRRIVQGKAMALR